MKAMAMTAIALAMASQSVLAQGAVPTHDITGLWDSAGGGTVQVFQMGDDVTMVFVGPDFAHLYTARYTKPDQTLGRQVRVVRASGCTTQMLQSFKVVSNDFVTIKAVALDSNCDLVKGEVITNALTRIH